MSGRSARAPIDGIKHVIKIDDWKFDYFFGVNPQKVVHDLPYWESYCIEVLGQITKPKLKALVGKIRISATDGLVARELKSTGKSHPIGNISYRAADYSAMLFMPSDTFAFVLQAFTANKYRWISMNGRKTGNGQVMVDHFHLSASMSDD